MTERKMRILDKLRTLPRAFGWGGICHEAADEIAQLRADRAQDQQRLFHLEADNARLRAALQFYADPNFLTLSETARRALETR
jgi:hypothetical protein